MTTSERVIIGSNSGTSRSTRTHLLSELCWASENSINFHPMKFFMATLHIADCWNCLPITAVVGDKIICMHGGISPHLQSLEQVSAQISFSAVLCLLILENHAQYKYGYYGEFNEHMYVISEILVQTRLIFIKPSSDQENPAPRGRSLWGSVLRHPVERPGRGYIGVNEF